jgi:hypothetical protein
MQGILGFFGAIISAVALAIAGSVAAVIFVVLWKSGTLPAAWGLATAFVTGAWGALSDFWGLLRELASGF